MYGFSDAGRYLSIHSFELQPSASLPSPGAGNRTSVPVVSAYILPFDSPGDLADLGAPPAATRSCAPSSATSSPFRAARPGQRALLQMAGRMNFGSVSSGHAPSLPFRNVNSALIGRAHSRSFLCNRPRQPRACREQGTRPQCEKADPVRRESRCDLIATEICRERRSG